MPLRRPSEHRRSAAAGIVLVLAIAVPVFILSQPGILRMGVLERLELATIDLRFRLRGPGSTPVDSQHVVIVEISEDAFAALPESYPWPRSYYAHAVRNLKAAGARVVGIDLILADHDRHNPQGDSLFRDALRTSRLAVLAGKREPDRLGYVRTSGTVDFGNVFFGPESALGLVNIRPNEDGVYREYPIGFLVDTPAGERLVPTFGFAVLNRYFGLPPFVVPEPDGHSFRYHGRTIPAFNPASLLINYLGPFHTFRHVHFHDVIDDSTVQTVDERTTGTAIDSFSDPDFGYLYDGTFREKIVLIGVTAPEYKDVFPVSYARRAGRGENLMYGVEIHANVIESVLRGNFLRRPHPLVDAGIILGLVALTFTLTAGGRGSRMGRLMITELARAGTTLLLLAAAAVAALLLFSHAGLVVSVTASFVSIAGGYAASTVYHLLTERRQRVLIKNMFSTYLNPSVVDELLADPTKLVLGGKREELTVLFSDIEGFTTISQYMAPEDLVTLLNEYLSIMSAIVFRRAGTLDKYEGDAIMAFWGAPVPQNDHALRACMTALDMLDALAEINRNWTPRGRPALRIRIGINTGQMVVGNMGATNKFDYTVIGDSVNLASRLEEANKQYETSVMVSERTFDLVRREIIGRQIDRIAVRGRTDPVTAFELLGTAGGASDPRLAEFLAEYSRGLELYYSRRWREATDAFASVLRLRPGDRPAEIHLERISQYQASPPPLDWDGVFVMPSK
jgi:adenylate cyclase